MCGELTLKIASEQIGAALASVYPLGILTSAQSYLYVSTKPWDPLYHRLGFPVSATLPLRKT
jgi:hypothetical protein